MSEFKRNPLLEEAGLYEPAPEEVQVDVDVRDFVELRCDDPFCKGRLKAGPFAYSPRSGRLYHVGDCMFAERMDQDGPLEFRFVSYEDGAELCRQRPESGPENPFISDRQLEREREEIRYLITEGVRAPSRIETVLDTLLGFMHLGVGELEFRRLLEYYRTFEPANARIYDAHVEKVFGDD